MFLPLEDAGLAGIDSIVVIDDHLHHFKGLSDCKVCPPYNHKQPSFGYYNHLIVAVAYSIDQSAQEADRRDQRRAVEKTGRIELHCFPSGHFKL